MFLDYEPMTEDQIDKIGLMAPGKYRFRCVEAIDKLSKQNKPQIFANLQIRHEDDSIHNLTAYLGTNGQYMLRLLRHYCYATGRVKEYEAKQVSASIIEGTEGIVEVDIKKGGPRFDDPSRLYPDQNSIVDYFPLSESDGMKPLPKVEDDFNDDITF